MSDDAVQRAYEHLKNRKLDIFERARLLDALKSHRQIPLKDIAKGCGMKSAYLCHILRLRRLPALVVDGYYSGSISISHLFIISRLRVEQDMILAYERVLSDNLTVLQTEELIREMLYQVKTEGEFVSQPEKEATLAKLKRAKIDSKIIQTRSRAKVILEFRGSASQTSPKLRMIMQSLSDIGD